MDGEIREQRDGQLQRRNPQARRRLEPRREVHEAAADELQRRTRRIFEPRFGRAPVRPAQLDQPQAGGQALGEVDHERRAVLAESVERGGERARGVDDDQVALVEELRQVMGVGVHDPEIGAVRNHHANRVARDPARFGRLGCFAYGDGGHGVTAAVPDCEAFVKSEAR